ncbi:uncharacterized protein ATC70_003369 [Mucor velutinosus]|uniref:UspA domain-containing protein n=1 Tax=Mucor velutinosus TaxID=708070 RepID=A0AAN7DBI4_9FUNG|nr:hypothetical protein ATC70_003369 [Mucor velutinosus]
MSSPVYRIVVAADDSPISKKAIDYAAKLCSNLSVPYKLDVVYAVGLNPAGITAFGFMSGLDRMNNVDIQQDAKESVANLNTYLAQFDETKSNAVIVKTSTKDCGYIIEDYINQDPPDMLVLGSSNKEGIQKFILGSVSDHCLHNCHCPVLIIKN